VRPEDIVDLDRYPIVDPGSPRLNRAIDAGQAALAGADGLALIPGFIRTEALAAMAREAQALTPKAFRRDEWYGIYAYDPDEAETAGLPEGDPRRRKFRSRMGAIAYDLLPEESPVRRLYEWPALTRFIADLTGQTELYTCADPLASCVISVLEPGDSHSWHYDQNDFVVSLLLQAAERGGLFEYAPNIRSEADENFAGVRRMLDGDAGLRRVGAIEPGCLALFRGQRSLHHVTTVEGSRPRLIALFSYDRKPGMMFRPEVHLRSLGRTLAA
jgi:alkylated DNA repair dioxygenase AlkB